MLITKPSGYPELKDKLLYLAVYLRFNMDNTKVFLYLESLEGKIKKLVVEHQSLKRELLASMEENKNLTMNLQNLEDEIHNLNYKRADSGYEKETLEEELEVVKAENKELMDALNNVQEHIKEVQNKSEALIAEYDRLKAEKDELTHRNKEIEEAYEQQLESVNEYLKNRDSYILERESLKIQLESFKVKNDELREKLENQEEGLKNFHNQEKNSKIVESTVEDSTKTNELKLRINEYIREIDKCISQLSD